MSKSKKITVRFYLNKDVKPQQAAPGEEKQYPIYCRVTYDRKNTKFRWGTKLIPESAEDEIMYSDYGKKVLQRDERTIQDIIRFEVENLGDRFVLSGLGDRIPAYQRIILFGFEALLNQNLDFFVGQFLVHNEFKEWSKQTFDEKLEELEDALDEDKWEGLSDILITQILTYKLLRNYPFLLSVFDWMVKDQRKLFRDHLVQLLDMNKAGKKVEVFGAPLVGDLELAESFSRDVTQGVDQYVIQVLTDNYQRNMGFQDVIVDPAKRKLRAS